MTRNSNGASQIWEIGGIVSTPPDLTLLKIINGATIVSDFNVSKRPFILTQNEVVELRIHGAGTMSASGPPNSANPLFRKRRRFMGFVPRIVPRALGQDGYLILGQLDVLEISFRQGN
ncbi:hypothetical protein B0H14DRAFT_2575141 [Mycena olivaceomarginata]|nr:hypothetical protein B0H14DRAFT_2575141 [Mycena olivaceomarginata]